MSIIKLKRLPHGEGLPLPHYASEGAAGFDLRSAVDVCLAGQDETSNRWSSLVISTGFEVELEPGWELQVRPRSGLAASHQVTVLNTPGTIDADYRGEIRVILINHGFSAFAVRRGDRIAQAVLAPIHRASFVELVEVDRLSETVRGAGGFGSTGRT